MSYAETVRRIRPILLLLSLILPASAQAAERLAFVVGVKDYVNLGPSAQLRRPAADAQAVAETLEGLGYKVTLLSSGVTQEAFLRRFGSFVDKVQPGDTALVYFAGHGIAMQGTNYLLPSDIPAIEVGQEMLARSRSLAEADLSSALRDKGARVVVMVVDACRDNPFPKNGTRSVGLDRGLARSEPADGVFSLYAAGAGQQALDRLPGDDPDPNSVFTRIFVRQLKKPGLNLIDLGESVRDEVAKLAETVPHKQVPAYYNEVRGARFLSLAGPETDVPSQTVPQLPDRPTTVTLPLLPKPQTVLKPLPPLQPLPQPSAKPSELKPPSELFGAPEVREQAQRTRYVSYRYPVGLDPNGDNWVALRSQPSGATGVRLMKLGPGALFTLIGRPEGSWVNVRLRTGETGWVHRDFVGCCRVAVTQP